jgi:hypothetical protein
MHGMKRKNNELGIIKTLKPVNTAIRYLGGGVVLVFPRAASGKPLRVGSIRRTLFNDPVMIRQNNLLLAI